MQIPFFLGLIAAMTHVISGPDHLAAVTPLVFDTRKKHWQIGLFWGVGHIIGMLLIGLLFFFFKDFIPVAKISQYSEQLVGVVLIGIGLWAFYRIKHRKAMHKHPHFHPDKDLLHIHKHAHEAPSHEHIHEHQKQLQNYWTATGVGIIHGFAGIAHFVLLLPVLGFSTRFESIQYMLGFALGIILAMIIYTAIIGKFPKKHPEKALPLYKNLQFWSGVLAIGVGLFWIISN